MSKKYVESLLFVAESPLSIKRISSIVEVEESIVNRWLRELIEEFSDRGFIIRQVAGGYEMVSASSSGDILEKVLPKKQEKLNKSTMETITIVSMKQPVTRSEISKYRQVQNPDRGIENAKALNLITESEQGYITTEQFLKVSGVNDLEELREKLSEIEIVQN